MSNIWDKTAQYYEIYYENQYKRADKLEKQLITKMLTHFPTAKSFLEVGCGTAHFIRWLNTLGLECYGIDQSSGMLKQAKKLWNQANLLKGDSAHLPIKDKSVDLVGFITSLEFMHDADFALTEGIRVARKGLILGLLNKNSTATLRRKLNPRAQDNPIYSQATYYSFNDVIKILEKISSGKYTVAFWSTTVFPRFIGNIKSALFPYGDFLGIAVKLC